MLLELYYRQANAYRKTNHTEIEMKSTHDDIYDSGVHIDN